MVLKEFRQFLLRGNVVDLAVAVVIGAAFGVVVTALVKDLLTPIVATIVGKPDFSGLTFTIHGSRFLYGHFLNAVLAFISVAAAIFFFVVKPMNVLAALSGTDESEQRECPECLTEIPKAARRCCACTAVVTPMTSS